MERAWIATVESDVLMKGKTMRIGSGVRIATTCALAFLFAGPSSAQDDAASVYLLKAGKVLTADGGQFEPGAVLVEGGKIRAVGGGGFEVPDGAVVRDFGERAVITPGLVDACVDFSLAGGDSEDGSEIVPLALVADALDPMHPAWQGMRRNGVTTVYVTPSGRPVLGGQGAIAKTLPTTGDEAWILNAHGQLKGTMGSEPTSGNTTSRTQPGSIFARRPTTRMGVVWEMRKAFFDALKAQRLAGENGVVSPEHQALLDVIAGKRVLRMRARLLNDIRTVVRIAQEFSFPIHIEEGIECFRAVPELKDAQATVLYGPIEWTLQGSEGLGFGFGESGTSRGRELDRRSLATAARLQAAGIPFALISAELAATPEGLPVMASIAVRHGLSKEAALSACTRVPAELLGVDGRVGTLAPGKDADLCVWTGEPFEMTTRPQHVMIDGRFVEGQE